MTGLDLAIEIAALAVLLRQLFILTAVGRTARFLPQRQPSEARRQQEDGPTFFVVLPVLRESAIIADAVAHFEALAHGHTAQVIVVTTAREIDEDQRQGAAGADTVALVEQLAARGKVLHLHYPDQHGLKGDQLNYAARHCAAALLGDVPAERAFLVCYDADSRPPLDSLDRFEQVIAASGGASVFHQSARFELRTAQTGQRRGIWSWLSRGVGEGAALRANRFVSGFEIPRLLNRSTAAGRLKRRLCSGVYAHVTGHGLCLRLSLLLDLPFPTRSPLEDMQYSFYLGSRNLAMVPVPSLDCAEVPSTVGVQVDQAARWFFGPARALRYLREPATQPGVRAAAMAASALGSSLEWLGCAVVPAATVMLLAFGHGLAWWTAVAVAAAYGAQLVITDIALGSPLPWPRRAVRILLCPIATTLFGIGGFAGMVRLWKGGSGVGKTERR
jgi:cellulose synthase/poly-beta-1,6-N-acetylglucosamine synthase-like glycosyltransferase